MLLLSIYPLLISCSQQLTESFDGRMTAEQIRELGEALSILSAKSSVLKERDELHTLMEENLHSEEVIGLRFLAPFSDIGG